MNVNGLNFATRRLRMAEWVKKKNHFINTDSTESGSEGLVRDTPGKWKPNPMGH